MSDERPAETPGEALARFLDALISPRETRSLDELRESVHAMGMDPDRLIGQARQQILRAQEEARLAWAKRAQVELPKVREWLKSLNVAAGLSREEQLSRLRRALGGEFGEQAQKVAAAFRNLESMAAADLSSIVEEIEALRLLGEGAHDARQ